MVAALKSFDRPASSARLAPLVCFRPTHPAFLQALSSSCAAATSWLPATCEFPSTLPTRGGSTVPVSRPIAYALPVPILVAASGVPFGGLRQAEHVSPIRFTSASKMVLRTHPHWWWKVKDSNLRVAVEQLWSYVYAALPCCCLSSQPTFHCALRFRRKDYPTTALHLRFSISPDANSL